MTLCGLRDVGSSQISARTASALGIILDRGTYAQLDQHQELTMVLFDWGLDLGNGGT